MVYTWVDIFVIVVIGRLIDGLGSRMGLCPFDHLMTW